VPVTEWEEDMVATESGTRAAAPHGQRVAVRVAEIAALCCGLGWVGKVLLIAGNGGEADDTGLVAVGWVVGMLGLLVTGGALGFAIGRRLGRVAAVLAAAVGVPVAFVLMNVADAAVKAVYDGDSWLRDELALLGLGAVCLVAGLLSLRARRPG
jgi:hypothetical protein